MSTLAPEGMGWSVCTHEEVCTKVIVVEDGEHPADALHSNVQSEKVVAITRTPNICAREELAAEHYLLTERPGRNRIQPEALTRIVSAARAVSEEAGHCTIIIEGIEYLVLYNGLNPVLRMLCQLADLAWENGHHLLILIYSPATSHEEIALIQRVCAAHCSAQTEHVMNHAIPSAAAEE
jgi:hypothetical protein